MSICPYGARPFVHHIISPYRLPHWRGSIILVVAALKTFRSAFSDCSKQYLVLMLTILIFQYNPRTGIISGGVEDMRGINEEGWLLKVCKRIFCPAHRIPNFSLKSTKGV